MNIVIDINALCSPRTGIGNYVYYLTETLLGIDAINTYYLYGPTVRTNPFPASLQGPRVRLELANSWSHKCVRRFGRRVRDEMDIYHVPCPFLPLPTSAGTKLVVTVHDLAFLYYPDSVIHLQAFRELMVAIASQMARASRIIAVSRNTADDVIRIFGVPPARVRVIPEAVDRGCYRPDTLVEPDPGLAGLPEKFFLCVGTVEPRKNHLTLLKAYGAFLRETGARDARLILVGGKGWKSDAVYEYIEQSDFQELIIHLTGLSNQAIAELYRRAVAMAYPSIYEGFGLPVLEAMACGCPVITSTVSSLPEVAGDAAILVDPHDVEALAHALKRVWADEDLRERMRQAGLMRAEGFSWEKAAQEVLAVYEQLGARSASAAR